MRAELRNIIYGYVLGGLELIPHVNICDGLQVRVMADGLDGSFHPARNLLAITQTCRQIQEEASLLMFSLNRMLMPHPEDFLEIVYTLAPR